MRRCSMCRVEKPFSEFYRDPQSTLGFGYNCKDCSRARLRARVRQKNVQRDEPHGLDAEGFKLPSRQWFEERFIPEPNSGCWLWERGVGGGYGIVFKYQRRPGRYAHRIAYELYVGHIPAGMEVCHRCDTPVCVNPAHLFLGTHQDNMIDMARKERHPWTRKNKTAA